MDRSTLQQHLDLAHRHAADGRKRVAHQEAIVDELREDGHDPTAAEALLETLRETQRTFVAEVERLERELAQAQGGA
jgi:hypothetical protein